MEVAEKIDEVEDPEKVVIEDKVEDTLENEESQGEHKQESEEVQETQEPEIDPIKEIGSLKEELNALKEWKEQRLIEEQKPKEPVEKKEITPEQWSAAESKFGFTRSKTLDDNGNEKEVVSFDPGTFVKSFHNTIIDTAQETLKEAEKLIHENVSELKFEAMTSAMSEEFPDMKQNLKEVKEYVDKRYSANERYSRQALKDGLIYARGLKQKDVIDKVRNSTEKNKKIIKPVPVSSKASKNNGLSPEERAELEMFYSKEEIEKNF